MHLFIQQKQRIIDLKRSGSFKGHSSRPKAMASRKRFLRRTAGFLVVTLLSRVYWSSLSETVPSYSSVEEMNSRYSRFPSVEDRIKAYMTNYFLPPCDESATVGYHFHPKHSSAFSWVELQEISLLNSSASPRSFVVTPKVDIARVVALEPQELGACYEKPWGIRFYCSDALKTLVETRQEVSPVWDDAEPISPPLLAQFGDEIESVIESTNELQHLDPRVPHFKKVRKALFREQVDSITKSNCSRNDQVKTLQPILWNLNVARHYGALPLVQSLDFPWNRKKDAAIFRGALTGQTELQASDNHTAVCISLPRCQLVYQYTNSSHVDAKLTSTAGRVPDTLSGVTLTAPVLLKERILAYKGIIILEGNDVASGLKWALLSKSVVLMPPPTITSWALEEYLQPWVHYIPLLKDLSDVETKVQWMIDHPEESQEIAHKGTLWILDLVYHPQAAHEEEIIRREILWRYQAHFSGTKTPPPASVLE